MEIHFDAAKYFSEKVDDNCFKIIVVGEKGCGKTTFIERFATRVRSEREEDDELPPPIEYETADFFDTMRFFKLVEIPSVSEELVNSVTEYHIDANGIIFMYAIDDPSGFEAMSEKWIQKMEDNGVKRNQPTFLIGNKEDARKNQQTIERLARANQALVTRQQGENLKDVRGLQGFFEISAPDINDMDEDFRSISCGAFTHWKKINKLD